jgi:hypothetical protein
VLRGLLLLLRRIGGRRVLTAALAARSRCTDGQRGTGVLADDLADHGASSRPRAPAPGVVPVAVVGGWAGGGGGGFAGSKPVC